MNIFNKIKDFFLEDDEDEVKPKSKPKQQPIEKQKAIKEVLKSDVTEKTIKVLDAKTADAFIKEEKPFKFPADFDDDDFIVSRNKTENKKKVIINPSYQSYRKKEEVKKFQPTPIISPIYGIMEVEDNNTNKVKFIEKKKQVKEEVTFDTVRQKAFGNLTDEIEDTLTRLNKVNFYNLKEEKIEKEVYDTKETGDKLGVTLSLEKEDIEKMENKIDKQSVKKTSKTKETIKFENVDITNVDKTNEQEEDTKEHDLFNLIEKMYEGSEKE